MTSRRSLPSAWSWIVFVGGLAAAVTAGVSTYRSAGLYGYPILTGFHREWNPRTRSYQLMHETTTKDGLRMRRLFSDGHAVQRVALTGDAVGPAVEQALKAGVRFGYSTRNDEVIDAWITRNPETEVARAEVSTRRNGKIDRWEHYVKGQLVRVDLDTDGNGKPDRWMTYEDGILMDTFIDADEDGQPDEHSQP